MSFLTVDHEKCRKDGICSTECPSSVITTDASGLPVVSKDREKICIKCGHCVVVCPYGALSIEGIASELCIPYKKELELSSDQLEQHLKSRRSIRRYLDKEIEPEKLEKLIDIARYAPTGGNGQLVEYLVINTKEQVQKLAGAVIDFMRDLVKTRHPIVKQYSLPHLIKAWDAGNDRIFRHAPGLVITHAPKVYSIASVDCSLALGYLELAAIPMGLGTCWAGFFMIASSQSQAVQNLLALPEGNICTGGLMIGYPRFSYQSIPPRKEAKVIWR